MYHEMEGSATEAAVLVPGLSRGAAADNAALSMLATVTAQPAISRRLDQRCQQKRHQGVLRDCPRVACASEAPYVNANASAPSTNSCADRMHLARDRPWPESHRLRQIPRVG